MQRRPAFEGRTWLRRDLKTPPALHMEAVRLSYGSLDVLLSVAGLERYAAAAGVLGPAILSLIGD